MHFLNLYRTFLLFFGLFLQFFANPMACVQLQDACNEQCYNPVVVDILQVVYGTKVKKIIIVGKHKESCKKKQYVANNNNGAKTVDGAAGAFVALLKLYEHKGNGACGVKIWSP